MSRIFLCFLIVTVAFAYANGDKDCEKCEPNAEPRPCGKLCEPSCEKPAKVFCTPGDKNACKQECKCKDGFVRNKATGECIKPQDCPKKCPKHEHFNKCGKMCEPQCTNPNPRCPKIACTKKNEDCRCDKGHLRDITTNKCVLQKDCVKCGTNEQVGHCGRICEGTCKNQDPGKCAAISCAGNGCQCKPNFYRNEQTDQCVPVDQCPKKCAYGEILAACGRTCEGTCKSPKTPEICSRIKCAKQECRCDLDGGFVREEKTGKCVRKGDCPC